MAPSSSGGDVLKQSYSWRIRALVLLNALLFVGMVLGDDLMTSTRLQEWETLINSKLVLILILPLATLLLDGIVTAEAKARFVFWRLKDPLPGSRAFSDYGPSDPRVDMAALEEHHGPLPSDGELQNRLWYRLSKQVSDRSSVLQAHRSFLLARDLTSLSMILLFVLGGVGALSIPDLRNALTYGVLLLAQYLLLRQVAVNNGRRFVTTVLAEAALLS